MHLGAQLFQPLPPQAVKIYAVLLVYPALAVQATWIPLVRFADEVSVHAISCSSLRLTTRITGYVKSARTFYNSERRWF